MSVADTNIPQRRLGVGHPMTTGRDLAESSHLSPTTFRRNGMPLATPVWVARDGDDLLFVRGADSGKAKRLSLERLPGGRCVEIGH